MQHHGFYRAGATGKHFKLNSLRNLKCPLQAGTVDSVSVKASKIKKLSTASKISAFNLKDSRVVFHGKDLLAPNQEGPSRKRSGWTKMEGRSRSEGDAP